MTSVPGGTLYIVHVSRGGCGSSCVTQLLQYLPYWSQLLSKEAQRGAAIEILNRVDGEAADREAARLRAASG